MWYWFDEILIVASIRSITLPSICWIFKEVIMPKKKLIVAIESKKLSSEEKFTQDVLTRGEAAIRDSNGNLPAGATHEIVKQESGKLPEIKRIRFSIA